MPKINSTAANNIDYLRVFECHGVDLKPATGDQMVAECPFCGTECFYVNRSNGLFDCKRCYPEGGNTTTFLRELWNCLSKDNYDYSELAKIRGLTCKDTPAWWGTVRSLLGDWLIPGLNGERQIVQLYRYVKFPGEDKPRLKPSPAPDSKTDSSGQGIHIINAPSNNKKRTVLLCEGVWDAMILSEVVDHDKYEVMAVPGCNIFQKGWLTLFANRDLIILFDNDYPDKNGRVPALAGLKRTASMLNNIPKSVYFLKWGNEEGYYDSGLPDGHDLSDHFRVANTLEGRRRLWERLTKSFSPVPREWVTEGLAAGLKPEPCYSWKDLIQEWRKAMTWPDSGETYDYALSMMLACIISTETQGEQLWLRLISPASSGKSVLCEALSVSKRFILPKSTLRPIYSGFKTGKDDNEDNSIMPELRGKTLVVKDCDPLLQSNQLGVILGQLRDLYDGAGRSHYNNRMSKNYENWRFTVIIGGTKNIAKLDRSELGERFVDCIMIEDMDQGLERDIRRSVALRAFRECKTIVNGVPESTKTKELIKAYKKTGGFIEYLRENADRLVNNVEEDEEALYLISDWAALVTYMRCKMPLEARGQVEIEPQRELPFRLTSQYSRLAVCLAAVLGKSSLDDSVMKRVKKSILDTSKGVNLQITRLLYSNPLGMELAHLAILLNETAEKMAKILRFLVRIEVVESVKTVRHINQTMWRLTPVVRSLYETIL